MKRIALYPFASQQDKAAGKFRLGSDSAVKFYSYMGERIQDMGWWPVFVLPPEEQCLDTVDSRFSVLRVPYKVSLSNRDRRLEWHPPFFQQLAAFDCVMTTHEFLSIPLRMLHPELKVVVEGGFAPTVAWPEMQAMFDIAAPAATLHHCSSERLAASVRHRGGHARVWPFAYDERQLRAAAGYRTIDVLFNARCSETGYSRHGLFFESIAHSPWKVCMTDQTNYLRQHGIVRGCPTAPTAAEYLDILGSSKVVVGLMDNGYGGHAFREAVAHGCVPVALNVPEYTDFLGTDWPYLCEAGSDSVRAAVERALAGMWRVPTAVYKRLQDNVVACSYAAAWKIAEGDLRGLLS